ncbi:MAG TPA: M23 family metallopeptidase, partial [Kofleriaceae bacterium]|nr:M23 family metallopeptidase [Kofleriaceae bacterium]
MANAGCPRCQRAVSLHDGRPFVTATGCVELWHRACFDVRDQPLAVESILEPPPVRYARAVTIATSRARLVGVASGVALLGVVILGWVTAGTPTAAIANVDLGASEAPTMRGSVTVHEVIPPRVVVRADELAIPTIDAVPLDRIYPALRGWIHPVAAATERVPELRSRRFGAERAGIERSECGAGHCGVDLHGPRGRPILSVAAGTIVHIDRSELGSDGKSGRYVRVEHDDRTLTAYMHLDDVAEELDVGDRVDAGQYVGTLGATAVYNAPPHLHFSLEVPDRPGVRGDHAHTEYVD